MKVWGIEFTVKDLKDLFLTGKEVFEATTLPKSKKNKIGIVIAIKTEKDSEKNRLKNDLVNNLNHYIKSSELADLFNEIIFLPERFCERINDQQTADKYLRLCRSNLMVYGSLTQRNIDGDNSYVFKLYGLVRHVPIKTGGGNHQRLIDDFSKTLSNVHFSETKEVLGFEITQNMIGMVSKLIVASTINIAGFALVSYRLINELLLEIETVEINRIKNPIVQQIKKRAVSRLIESSQLLISHYYDKFIGTRDDEDLFMAADYLERLLEVDPLNYSGHLTKAMVLFRKEEIDAAISILEDLDDSDPTWRYSLGFLYAFRNINDDIEKALDQYRRATYKQAESNVINDTEIFLSEEIVKHPEKIQLHFFRGLINHKCKPDYHLANEDFRYFLNQDASRHFPRLRVLSSKYLSEIRDHIVQNNSLT